MDEEITIANGDAEWLKLDNGLCYRRLRQEVNTTTHTSANIVSVHNSCEDCLNNIAADVDSILLTGTATLTATESSTIPTTTTTTTTTTTLPGFSTAPMSAAECTSSEGVTIDEDDTIGYRAS